MLVEDHAEVQEVRLRKRERSVVREVVNVGLGPGFDRPDLDAVQDGVICPNPDAAPLSSLPPLLAVAG
jgi:hypothetical protein